MTYSSKSTSSIVASMDPFELNQNSNSLYGEDEGPYAIGSPDFLFVDFTDNTTQDADAFYSYFQNHLSSFTSMHNTFVENVSASQAFSEPSALFLNVQDIPNVTAFRANLDIHHSTFGPTHNTEFPVENPDIQQLIDALSTSTPDLPSTSSNIAIFQAYIDKAINSILPNSKFQHIDSHNTQINFPVPLLVALIEVANWHRLAIHLGVKAWSLLCHERLVP